MTDLNELFEHILYSERKFKARIDELRQLGSELEKSQSELQHLREEIHTKQGELAVKRNKLSDQVTETEVFTVRQCVLQDQRLTLVQSKDEITHEYEQLEKEHELILTNFSTELSEFSRLFDLKGSGCKEREEEMKKRKKLLQDELLLLETELIEINSQKEELSQQTLVLANAEKNLKKAKSKLAEIRKSKQEIEIESKSLELDKKNIDEKLAKDPEFTRLRRELESCKDSTGELACKQLHKDLDDLQRHCYHKQMRKQLYNHSNKNDEPSQYTSSNSSGHYNPYTNQYVPATNLARNYGADHPSNKSKEMFFDDLSDEDFDVGGLNEDVVDEYVMNEWEITDEENDLQSLDITDSINADTHYDSYEQPKSRCGTKGIHRNTKCSTNTDLLLTRPTGASFSKYFKGHSLNNGRENISNSSHSELTGASRSSQSNNQQERSLGRLSSTAGMKQPTGRNVEANPGFGQGKIKTVVKSKRIVSNSSQSTKRGSQSEQASFAVSLVQADGSPDCSHTQRKRQGESIFKTPYTEQTQESSLPKRAKKVRFHY